MFIYGGTDTAWYELDFYFTLLDDTCVSNNLLQRYLFNYLSSITIQAFNILMILLCKKNTAICGFLVIFIRANQINYIQSKFVGAKHACSNRLFHFFK